MNYTLEIIINAPQQKVAELYDNVDNFKHWQEGLQDYIPLSGTARKPGAKAKMIFKMGKKLMEIEEVIRKQNFPIEYEVTYESIHMFNVVASRFIPIDENNTRYVSNNEIKPKGFFKIMVFLFPKMFKKQSLIYLEAFKKFVESKANINS